MKRARIVVSGLLLLSIAALATVSKMDSPQLFDSQVWKDQEALDSNKRLKMIRDLKPKLMGISTDEVKRLLGKPRKDLSGPSEYFYLLGVERRPFDDDGVWLSIKFEKNCVSDIQVIRD